MAFQSLTEQSRSATRIKITRALLFLQQWALRGSIGVAVCMKWATVLCSASLSQPRIVLHSTKCPCRDRVRTSEYHGCERCSSHHL